MMVRFMHNNALCGSQKNGHGHHPLCTSVLESCQRNDGNLYSESKTYRDLNKWVLLKKKHISLFPFVRSKVFETRNMLRRWFYVILYLRICIHLLQWNYLIVHLRSILHDVCYDRLRVFVYCDPKRFHWQGFAKLLLYNQLYVTLF